MSSNYTPAQEQVADISDRFQEHDKLYGKSVRDDKYIWRQVDSMTVESLFYLIYWAQQHPDYTSTDWDDWLEELQERDPFFVRQKTDKFKKGSNNYHIWRMMMMVKEAIRQRLKEEDAPDRRLFDWSK